MVDDEEKNYDFFNGMGFTMLDKKNAKNIEAAYEKFKMTKRPQETFISSGNDVYQIKFDYQQNGDWKIVNTQTQVARDLKRKVIVKGPFIESKQYEWMVLSGGQAVPIFE